MELEEIEGYTKRLKLLARYDKAEPKIAFYANLEQKKASKDIIGQLAEHSEGPIYTNKNELMDITTNFYKNLYTPNRVNSRTQDKLLKLIKNKLTKEQRETLDPRLQDEEIERAVFSYHIFAFFHKTLCLQDIKSEK